MTVLTVLVFFDRFLPGQEPCYWFILVRIHFVITKFDVNDGVNLTIFWGKIKSGIVEYFEILETKICFGKETLIF